MCSLLWTGNVLSFKFLLWAQRNRNEVLLIIKRGEEDCSASLMSVFVSGYICYSTLLFLNYFALLGEQDNCSCMCTRHHRLFCHTRQIIAVLVSLMCCLSLSFLVWLPSNSFSALQRTKRLSPAVNYSLLMPLWRVNSLSTKVIILIEIPADLLVALPSFCSTVLPDWLPPCSISICSLHWCVSQDNAWFSRIYSLNVFIHWQERMKGETVSPM